MQTKEARQSRRTLLRQLADVDAKDLETSMHLSKIVQVQAGTSATCRDSGARLPEQNDRCGCIAEEGEQPAVRYFFEGAFWLNAIE